MPGNPCPCLTPRRPCRRASSTHRPSLVLARSWPSGAVCSQCARPLPPLPAPRRRGAVSPPPSTPAQRGGAGRGWRDSREAPRCTAGRAGEPLPACCQQPLALQPGRAGQRVRRSSRTHCSSRIRVWHAGRLAGAVRLVRAPYQTIVPALGGAGQGGAPAGPAKWIIVSEHPDHARTGPPGRRPAARTR